MKKVSLIPILICFLATNTVKAQQMLSPGLTQKPVFAFTLFKLQIPQQLQLNYANNFCVIHHSIPQGAIFCRLEDALHKHFNFWIKFRMGTDDRYSD